jgi:predicted DCC family thiol-disulfide oxidoreductase YuxK
MNLPQKASPELKHIKPSEHGCLLYDGSCGACSHLIGGRADFYQRYGFAVAAAQEDWAQEKLAAVGMQSLREIRLLKPDGSCLSGPDVYREITRKIWWLLPIHIFSRLPLFRHVFNLGYRIFSANRYRLSQACGWESRARHPKA